MNKDSLNDKSPLWRNICQILDREANYYKAEVGDRLSNIYDLADMIVAQVERDIKSVIGGDHIWLDDGKGGIAYIPPDPPSEIPVVDDHTIRKILAWNISGTQSPSKDKELIEGLLNELRPYLRRTESVNTDANYWKTRYLLLEAKSKPVATGEISDALRNELVGLISKTLYCDSYTAATVVTVLKPYLRTPEPVSVSLRNTVTAVDQEYDFEHYTVEQVVKAVLDAAGVKYE